MFADVILPAIAEAKKQGHKQSDIVIYVSQSEAEELKENTVERSDDSGDVGVIEGPSVLIDDDRSGEWELKEQSVEPDE